MAGCQRDSSDWAAAGIPVKILKSIGGLAPAILALSGFFLGWKRKFR